MTAIQKLASEIEQKYKLSTTEFLLYPYKYEEEITNAVVKALESDISNGLITICEATDEPKWVIYVWELENGFYYVGKTTNLPQRCASHLMGQGAERTKLHKPVKLLKLVINGNEHNTTIDYMVKYGDRVRGAAYCRENLSSTKQLKDEIYLQSKYGDKRPLVINAKKKQKSRYN